MKAAEEYLKGKIESIEVDEFVGSTDAVSLDDAIDAINQARIDALEVARIISWSDGSRHERNEAILKLIDEIK